MTMGIRLSICIPTYNRELFLADTLESIITQLDTDIRSSVEICISDNASTDNTEDLVEKYSEVHPHIVYHKWPQNMGADRNYLKVVEIAHGEFCWLFGSDDVMMPGAIKRVLTELETQPDIVLYERAESDKKLCSEPRYSRWTGLRGDYDFDSKQARGRFLQYLSACHSFGGLFSYLSVIVFRHSRWQSIANKDRFVGSAYVHVHVLLEILKQGADFHYRSAVVVLCRTGNDSFLSDESISGNYRRIRLDVDGYREIPGYVFGVDSEEYQLIRLLVARCLPVSGLMKYKLAFLRMGDNESSRKMNRMLLANGFIFKHLCLKLLENRVLLMVFTLLSRFNRAANSVIPT